MTTIKQALSQTSVHWRSGFKCEKTINWFPGHMAKGVKQMRDQLRSVDLIVETRDARIPLSSINRQFEDIVGSKDRLVVYNKADLAPAHVQRTIEMELTRRTNHRVVFTDAISDNASVKRILAAAVDKAQADPFRFSQYSIMVVGMPNVGKSSLINALRRIGVGRGKAAPTGAKPGVTRALSSRIKVLDSPAVYLVDTPGVMAPHIHDPETAIKVALTGGIKDDVADESVLADYLLFRLNRIPGVDYCSVLGIDRPTDDINALVSMLGARIGALRKGGELDVEKTLGFFLRAYRDGRFGHHCLDDIDEAAVDAFFAANLLGPAPMSRNQEKKAKRAEQRKRSLEKKALKAGKHD
ncbi:Mitochondrial GTPase 1 [Coemansia sp. RSA 1813]|nr:Mitochondrial GTPase 1 [Coemansia sp. RSA 1843]KAJ2085778.1 Mitochondrial GTPase 1 [Coemansia sp. RSA 986]KAJ2211922.1 Mitochondrial GTPase 1 [Coemansia sp. RSA 487]KAJ2563341.1 Mitochondrial GTPase 1 [Coemansia sp. RSA 1813]